MEEFYSKPMGIDAILDFCRDSDIQFGKAENFCILPFCGDIKNSKMIFCLVEKDEVYGLCERYEMSCASGHTECLLKRKIDRVKNRVISNIKKDLRKFEFYYTSITLESYDNMGWGDDEIKYFPFRWRIIIIGKTFNNIYFKLEQLEPYNIERYTEFIRTGNLHYDSCRHYMYMYSTREDLYDSLDDEIKTKSVANIGKKIESIDNDRKIYLDLIKILG